MTKFIVALVFKVHYDSPQCIFPSITPKYPINKLCHKYIQYIPSYLKHRRSSGWVQNPYYMLTWDFTGFFQDTDNSCLLSVPFSLLLLSLRYSLIWNFTRLKICDSVLAKGR